MDVFCGGSARCSDGAAFNYAMGVLLLTLALSIGDALEAPTWRAVLPEVVPQEGPLATSALRAQDRKSTRLKSSHQILSNTPFSFTKKNPSPPPHKLLTHSTTN